VPKGRLFAAAVLLVALCAAGGPWQLASAQSEGVIHVGVSAFEAHGDIYYAQDLGLFKRAGLNIDVAQYQGGSIIVAAIVSGALQIGAGSPLPLANARLRGLPVVLIAPGYIYSASAPSPIDALAVAVNSPARTGKDLNGKTVAVTGLKSVDHIAVFGWIDQHRGDSSTVKVVELPQSAMADAVADGRVDAAEIGDPALTAGIDAGRVRIIGKAYDSIAKRFFAASWFSTEDWATKNPDTVRKFARAINEASAWAVKNPEQAATILQKYMKVTFNRAHEYHANTLDKALLQPLLDSAVKYKFLDPMNAQDLIWKGYS
jgi:NitT/TauT family transport system substrate-binding protein